MNEILHHVKNYHRSLLSLVSVRIGYQCTGRMEDAEIGGSACNQVGWILDEAGFVRTN